MNLPNRVTITEVGPRDGLQMETRILSIEQRLDLIAGLVAAGLSAIQVASFVHPGRVPQMADAEALIQRLPPSDAVQFSALTLNLKGVERACRTSIPWIEASFSVSETHCMENSGMTVAQACQETIHMIAAGQRTGRKIRGSLQCAFGCTDPMDTPLEQVVQAAQVVVDQGVDRLVLADTAGLATPPSVRRMLAAVLPVAGAVPVALHLHDTRGLGLVNVLAAMEMGITHFDTSLGGLGGCPFMKGAAGNIATEDTLHLMDALGISTGVRIAPIARWSRRLSRLFGHDLPGKVYRLGPDDPPEF